MEQVGSGKLSTLTMLGSYGALVAGRQLYANRLGQRAMQLPHSISALTDSRLSLAELLDNDFV